MVGEFQPPETLAPPERPVRGDTVEFLTLERGMELLAGRRAWEAENGGAPAKKGAKKTAKKASRGSKKSAPTLTAKVVKATGAPKAKKKAASGKGKALKAAEPATL